MKKVLDQIAETVISLDESSLTELLPEFKNRMDSFEPNREWEKSVIIFFLINAVRVKNTLFNENVLKKSSKKNKSDQPPTLKIVK